MELGNQRLPVNKALLYINFITTILYINWWFTPYIYRNMNKIYLAVLLLIWFTTAFLTELAANNVKLPLILLPIFGWISYSIILRLLDISTASWGNYFSHILFWFSIIIFTFYNKYMNLKLMRKTLKYTIIIVLVNVINNIWIIYNNPQMLQFITNDGNLGIAARSTNVGSTNFSFMVLLCTSFMWSLLTLKKSTIKKLSYFLIIGIFSFYLYMASKTTALLLLLFSVISFIYFQITNKKKTRSRIVIESLIFVFFLIGLLSLPHILYFSAGLIQNDNISERLFALSSFMKGATINSNSVSFRILAWETSIRTFIANPLFGIGYHTYMGVNFSGTGIGEHSEIFDNFAKYGLVGVSFLITIFGLYWLHYLKTLNISRLYAGVKNIFFIFFIYSFFNSSITPESGILLFLIAPLFASLDMKEINQINYKQEDLDGNKKQIERKPIDI